MGRPATRRPCIEPGCTTLAPPGASRCTPHQRQHGTAHNHQRRTAPGNGAAARLRARLKRAGAGTCGTCGRHLPATALRVDHRLALADGGTDTDPNVWLLCTEDHDRKSADERRARARD